MTTILRTLIRPLALLLLCTVATAQAAGAFRMFPGGGEHSGGSGVWILPKAASFASPDGATGSLQVVDNNNLLPVTPDSWERDGDDLLVFYGSLQIAVIRDFFDEALNRGTCTDIYHSKPGTWERDDSDAGE